MKQRQCRFVRDETGAASADWVSLSFIVVLLTGIVVLVIQDGTIALFDIAIALFQESDVALDAGQDFAGNPVPGDAPDPMAQPPD
jgi:hypothetical protein